MKKLPRGVYLSLFLLVVAVIAGAILSGINMLTAPIIEENRMKELQKTFDEIGVTIEKEEVVELLDGVTAVYTGAHAGTSVYVVTTTNSNKYTTVNLITVFNKATGEVVTGKITGTPQITTHGYDGSFTVENVGLVGATSVEDLKTVSGATFSLDSVKACFAVAMEQYKKIAGTTGSAPKPADYIESYDEATGTFVVKTKMQYGSVFTSTIVVDAEGNITSYEVTSDKGFTVHYDGYDQKINDFIASVQGTNVNLYDSLEYVSGATATSNEFKKAFELVKEYLSTGGAA